MRVLRVEGPLDEAELIQLMKQETNLKVRRWLHILILVKKVHSALDSAELLQVHEKTVRRIVQRYNKEGLQGLAVKLICKRKRSPLMGK